MVRENRRHQAPAEIALIENVASARISNAI
jgi:hypothetical protein